MALSQTTMLGRGLYGLVEGALWGAFIGLLRGGFRTILRAPAWHEQIGYSVLIGLVIGSLVCAVGRAISGRLEGAWIGFVVGALFGFAAGALLGNSWGVVRWTVHETDRIKVLVQPIGMIVGAIAGPLCGCAIGAWIDRRMRKRSRHRSHMHK